MLNVTGIPIKSDKGRGDGCLMCELMSFECCWKSFNSFNTVSTLNTLNTLSPFKTNNLLNNFCRVKNHRNGKSGEILRI